MKLNPVGMLQAQAYPRSAQASTMGAASFSATLASTQENTAWQTALAAKHAQPPQLVNVDLAAAGGLKDLQTQVQGLLRNCGLDPNEKVQLSFDAASESFRVEGSPAAKAALEAELNRKPPAPSATTFKEDFAMLSDIVSSAAAVRTQYMRDHEAQQHSSASWGRGYAYRFDLVMQSGQLSYDLVPI